MTESSQSKEGQLLHVTPPPLTKTQPPEAMASGDNAGVRGDPHMHLGSSSIPDSSAEKKDHNRAGSQEPSQDQIMIGETAVFNNQFSMSSPAPDSRAYAPL